MHSHMHSACVFKCAFTRGGQRLTSGSIRLMFLRQGLSPGPDSVWFQEPYCLYHLRTELEIMCNNTCFFVLFFASG